MITKPWIDYGSTGVLGVMWKSTTADGNHFEGPALKVVALLVAAPAGTAPLREASARAVTRAGLRPVVRVGTAADPAERLALLVGQALRDQVSAIALVVDPALPADVAPAAKASHDAGVPLVLVGADQQQVDRRARVPGHYVAAYVPGSPGAGSRAAQAALRALSPTSSCGCEGPTGPPSSS
jgi:hypothetical protein